MKWHQNYYSTLKIILINWTYQFTWIIFDYRYLTRCSNWSVTTHFEESTPQTYYIYMNFIYTYTMQLWETNPLVNCTVLFSSIIYTEGNLYWILREILGNYTEKCLVRIWKRYIPLLIDFLISNNFSSKTFFLRNAYFKSYRSSKYTTVNWFFTDFFGIIKKNK